MGHNFEVEIVRKIEVENVHKTVTKLKLKAFESESCVLFMARVEIGRNRLSIFFLVSGVLELGWSSGSFEDPTHQKKSAPVKSKAKHFLQLISILPI